MRLEIINFLEIERKVEHQENLVKAPKISFDLTRKSEIEEKTRQNTENKQTLTGKYKEIAHGELELLRC